MIRSRGRQQVTAPKTYKPTGDRPREHLAYLNENEMRLLRIFNGDNQESGPKGLPSFPYEDAQGGTYNSGYGSGGGGTANAPGGTGTTTSNTTTKSSTANAPGGTTSNPSRGTSAGSATTGNFSSGGTGGGDKGNSGTTSGTAAREPGGTISGVSGNKASTSGVTGNKSTTSGTAAREPGGTISGVSGNKASTTPNAPGGSTAGAQKASTTPRAPAASAAAAKANATKTTTPKITTPATNPNRGLTDPTAKKYASDAYAKTRRGPGASEAAAKANAVATTYTDPWAKQGIAPETAVDAQRKYNSLITQPRDELGPIPSHISPDEYGWTSTGPSRVAAHIGYGIRPETLLRQGETFTQDQVDTVLDSNLAAQNQDLLRRVEALSPTKRTAAAALTTAAQFNGIPVETALGMGAIESGLGTIPDRPGAKYEGLTQMGDNEWRTYASPDSAALGKDNMWGSAQAGLSYMSENAARFKDQFGREPTLGETYGMHQQGYAGYTGLLGNPDSLAKDVVGLKAVTQNGGRADMTAVEFADHVAAMPVQKMAEHIPGVDSSQTQVAAVDPATRPFNIPEPTGSVFDTVGFPSTQAPMTNVASLEEAFAPKVTKMQDRIPATEPSYFVDIANGYISPAPPPPRPTADAAPQPTGTWDREIEAATGQPYAAPMQPATGQPYANFTRPISPAGMSYTPSLPAIGSASGQPYAPFNGPINPATGQPYAAYTAPINPATGQPYAAYTAPAAPDIFTGGNSAFALPDTIPGFADQGRRLSIPGSWPAIAAPANLPAQGQPYAAFNGPATPVASTIDPAQDAARFASLANALGVQAPIAKQFGDRVVTMRMEDGTERTFKLTAEQLADPAVQKTLAGYTNEITAAPPIRPDDAAYAPSYMDDLAALTAPTAPTVTQNIAPAYRDPWAEQTPQFQERITADEPDYSSTPSPKDVANLMRLGVNLYPDQLVADNSRVFTPTAEGDLDINPEDDPEEADVTEQSLEEQRQSTDIDNPDNVPVYDGPSTVVDDEKIKYPVKGGKVQKGTVATGLAAGSLVSGLPLNFLQKPANYLVNRLRNAPNSGEPGAAMQRMQDNAANRSSFDNQAAQQQAQQALATYYELLYAGLIPNDGTVGNNGTPYPPAAPPSAPSALSADQLALIYNTFV